MLEVWEPFITWFENTTGITDFTIAWTLIFAGAMLIPLLLMLAASFVSSIISGEALKPDMIPDQTAEISYPSSKSLGETLSSNFIRFGYSFIPLGLGIHLAHNSKHFLGEGLSVIYTSASLIGLKFHWRSIYLKHAYDTDYPVYTHSTWHHWCYIYGA